MFTAHAQVLEIRVQLLPPNERHSHVHSEKSGSVQIVITVIPAGGADVGGLVGQQSDMTVELLPDEGLDDGFELGLLDGLELELGLLELLDELLELEGISQQHGNQAITRTPLE